MPSYFTGEKKQSNQFSLSTIFWFLPHSTQCRWLEKSIGRSSVCCWVKLCSVYHTTGQWIRRQVVESINNHFIQKTSWLTGWQSNVLENHLTPGKLSFLLYWKGNGSGWLVHTFSCRNPLFLQLSQCSYKPPRQTLFPVMKLFVSIWMGSCYIFKGQSFGYPIYFRL